MAYEKGTSLKQVEPAEAFEGHKSSSPLLPSYDMDVGAAYLNLCSCPVALTTDHMITTANSINIDYSSTLEEGLHARGVELLNLARFDFLEADLLKLGIEASSVAEIVDAFKSNFPA